MSKIQDIVVVSPDVRGFWHCDYWDRSETESDEVWRFSAAPPDEFFTTEIGATEGYAVSAAKKVWPSAIIEVCSGFDDEDSEWEETK